MKVDDVRQGFETLKESLADGWARLRRQAAGALTRFKASDEPQANTAPTTADIDELVWPPGPAWSMLGGDVYEDDRRVIVRLEVPGLTRDALDLHVVDNALIVRGDKRFEREQGQGRWRVVQCAYGRFERVVALPSAVNADEARATYRDGVLRVELKKTHPSTGPRRIEVRAA